MKRILFATLFIIVLSIQVLAAPPTPPSGSMNDASTSLSGLWSSKKTYDELALKMSIASYPKLVAIEALANSAGVLHNNGSGVFSYTTVATDNSTASNSLIKDASGYVANATYSIDAHAASTTITLIPGSCPIIHNASQADSNINNTLPAVGAGKCFVALATSAKADKYWRLTAAAANTVCLNRTAERIISSSRLRQSVTYSLVCPTEQTGIATITTLRLRRGIYNENHTFDIIGSGSGHIDVCG
jgi:hypothetical protein